jgi:6-phosphogluconolactonase
MKTSLREPLLMLGVFALFTGKVSAQNNFIYTNNNPSGPNTVSGYSVAGDGSLTPVSGSPFVTIGVGTGNGFFASSRITASAAGNFLYVANAGSDDVSVFSIDPVTGALTLVPGSPFDTGGASGQGISLAATPDNRFLFAGNVLSQNITVFAINPDGSLSRTGDPVFAAGQPNGVKVTPDGRFLVAVLANVGPHASVVVFGIGSDGTLTPRFPFPIRPFGGPDGTGAGIDISCDSTTIAVGEARSAGTTLVDVFTLDPDTGALGPIAGSPFDGGSGLNSNVPLFSPDDSILFVSNQNNSMVTSFGVDPSDHHLTFVGTFPAGGATPAGMATDAAGTFLYAAKFPNTISVFTISDGGTLSLTSTTIQSGSLGLESLTAFPAKSCSGSSAR